MKNSIINECVRTARSEISGHPEFTTNGYLHWSFIVQKNKILGRGKNKVGKPYYNGFGYSDISKIHSEGDVYRRVKGIIESNLTFEVINIRLNRQGDLRLSKPCDCCFRFLNFVGCKTVYFSTDLGFARLML